MKASITSTETRRRLALVKPLFYTLDFARPKGFPPRELITSLLDAVKHPAAEIAELYHERWDVELSYDELKTDVLKNEETIRSETPEGVRQELWGIAIAYNLVRREMAAVAKKMKVPARRVSFSGTLRIMQDLFFWQAGARSPGAIPRFLQRYRKKLKKLILPPRNTDRFVSASRQSENEWISTQSRTSYFDTGKRP